MDSRLSLRAVGPYGTGIVWCPVAEIPVGFAGLKLGSFEAGWKKLVKVQRFLGRVLLFGYFDDMLYNKTSSSVI